MMQDIKKNKMKTGFIVSIFVILLTLIVYFICMAFDLGITSLVIALVVSCGSAFFTYYYCDKAVLASCHARVATKEENQKLVNILDALMLSSGLTKKPRLYVVEDAQPNAFATGRNPENAVICVTTGLLEKLEYYELEGVIAHELSHIKNYDIRLSAVITVMVGFIIMLTDWVSRGLFWRNFDSDDRDNKGIFTATIGIFLLVLSPLFAKLMQLAVSRRREFLADTTAAQMTRNPDGLISALQKLDSDPNELKNASMSTSHLFIAEPFKDNKNKKKKTDWFSTHPSIEDRIEALKNIQ